MGVVLGVDDAAKRDRRREGRLKRVVDLEQSACHDLALALYLCYELHYLGLPDVEETWEWEPSVLRERSRLEDDLAETDPGSLRPVRSHEPLDGAPVERLSRNRIRINRLHELLLRSEWP